MKKKTDLRYIFGKFFEEECFSKQPLNKNKTIFRTCPVQLERLFPDKAAPCPTSAVCGKPRRPRDLELRSRPEYFLLGKTEEKNDLFLKL